MLFSCVLGRGNLFIWIFKVTIFLIYIRNYIILFTLKFNIIRAPIINRNVLYFLIKLRDFSLFTHVFGHRLTVFIGITDFDTEELRK